jgi:hypothetical protein
MNMPPPPRDTQVNADEDWANTGKMQHNGDRASVGSARDESSRLPFAVMITLGMMDDALARLCTVNPAALHFTSAGEQIDSEFVSSIHLHWLPYQTKMQASAQLTARMTMQWTRTYQINRFRNQMTRFRHSFPGEVSRHDGVARVLRQVSASSVSYGQHRQHYPSLSHEIGCLHAAMINVIIAIRPHSAFGTRSAGAPGNPHDGADLPAMSA